MKLALQVLRAQQEQREPCYEEVEGRGSSGSREGPHPTRRPASMCPSHRKGRLRGALAGTEHLNGTRVSAEETAGSLQRSNRSNRHVSEVRLCARGLLIGRPKTDPLCSRHPLPPDTGSSKPGWTQAGPAQACCPLSVIIPGIPLGLSKASPFNSQKCHKG